MLKKIRNYLPWCLLALSLAAAQLAPARTEQSLVPAAANPNGGASNDSSQPEAKQNWEQYVRNEFGVDPQELGLYLADDTADALSAEQERMIQTRRQQLLAERKIQQREHEAGLNHFERALELNAANPYLQLGKVRALLGLRRNQEALALLDQLQRDFPQLPETYQLRGSLLEGEEKNNAAAAAYRAGLEHHPKQLELLEAAANLATKMDNLDLAIEYYERITAIDGHQIYAYYILGRFYMQKANLLANQWRANHDTDKQRAEFLRKAEENFRHALDLKDDIQDFYKFLGRVHEQLFQQQAAHQVYADALVRFPHNREFQALFEVSLGPDLTLEDKLAAYEILVQNNSDNYALKDLYARTAEKYGQIELALQIYRELIESDASQLDPYLKLSELQLRHNQFRAAIETLEHALLFDEKNYKIQNDLAEAYFKTGRFDKAAEFYQNLLRQNPQQSLYYSNLYACYRELHETARALDILNQLAARFGENEAIFMQQGKIFLDTGRLEEGQRSFEKALALNEKNEDAYRELLLIYLLNAQDQKIAWLLEKGATAFTQQPERFYEIQGETFLKTHRYQEAATQFERILAADKASEATLKNLAVCYAGLKFKDKRRELLEHARRIVTDAVQQNLLAAEISFEFEEFKAAQDYCREARQNLEHDPQRSADSRLQMSIDFTLLQALAGQKKKTPLREQLAELKRKYLAEYPETLVRMSFFACRTAADLDHFNLLAAEALAQTGDRAEIYYYLGSSYFELGTLDQAEVNFKRAIELNPRDADALNALGYMFAEKGIRLDEARELLEQAYQLRPLAGHIIDSLGWLYYQEGEFKKAVQLLEQAAVFSSPDSVIYEHLGDAYNQLGQPEQAIKSWTRSIDLDAENSAKLKIKIEAAKAGIAGQ